MEMPEAIHRGKKPRLSENEENADRLSKLSDSILYEILSYLPTKTVVHLSILSKRWRYLWASIPYLQFPQPLPPVSVPATTVEKMRARAWRDKFVGFVDSVLFARNASKIQSFSLNWRSEGSATRPAKWISYAVRHGVQEIDIGFRDEGKLPPCLFTCNSLTSLKIYLSDGPLELPSSMSFSRLKTLYFQWVRLSDGSKIRALFSSCPVLENLTLDSCSLYLGFRALIVSTPALKYLAILHCEGFAHTTFILSAPSISSFKYIGTPAPNEYRLAILSSLIDAKLDLRNSGLDIPDNTALARLTAKDRSLRAVKLIYGLRHAKTLELCHRCIEFLGTFEHLDKSLPSMFSNLKYLKISSRLFEKEMQSIVTVLKTAPNVQTLVLESIQVKDVMLWEGEKIPWKHTMDQLKQVELINFVGAKQELEFLKFVLRNFKFLERVFITPKMPIAQNILNEQLSFPSISSMVQIWVRR
ncbi:F-box/LRR-repeat protein At4g14103-like [Aristolochia californica]|uniref:F-box/LRR-repeat protein At4g14103-like n=1 Tax=Aristolochia californica TaxID=171875 RepID=UPI0035DBF7D8